jgi:hypothetical protein
MHKSKKRIPAKRITNPVLKQGPTTATIQVQLDARTRITIHDMSAFTMWLVKYPGAKIIERPKI